MADIEFIRCSGTNEDFIENCQLLDMDLDRRVLGSVLIGFFANQLDTILGCVCFILGIILLVGSSMSMLKQD